jgi:biopolymer transport protein ExbD
VASTPEVIQSKSIVIEGIKNELLLQRSKSIGAEASEVPEVNVLADKSIPFKLLKKIMSSCTSAGYAKISLAVIQKASQS